VGADPSSCNPAKQTWCGGTWNTIRENLDYVQNAGFTAIWISPVSQNYEGPTTVYGDAYTGYWIADVTQLNARFGTSEDLKALSGELHKRGMYLMVDVVVNNVMATTITPDLSTYFFKEQSQYHKYCPIEWGNTTSEQDCWLGDTKVPLPDLNTQDPTVVSGYANWIKSLVTEYSIDGLRIDAAKHVNIEFWPQMCGAAGVFCMGEVFGSDINAASIYQGPQALDSILQYPMYTALVEAFAIPGPQNISALTDMMNQSKAKFVDPGLLGNFLENQDLPRWHNQSVDPQSLYNAMAFNFMSDGIPIVYYGQEQAFSGNGDPFNREPLWISGYAKTPAYSLIATFNQFRNFLVNASGDWLHSDTQILTSSPYGIAIMKGNVISVLTNIGSPPQNGTSISVYTPWDSSTATTNILTCEQWATGSGGSIDVEYTKGGVPVILIPTTLLAGSGMCGFNAAAAAQGKTAVSSDASPSNYLQTMTFWIFLSFILGLFVFCL